MSAQLIELLFFAGIAFLIISKLIGTLGTTSHDDPAAHKSFFGEKTEPKDVTPAMGTRADTPEFIPNKLINISSETEGLLTEENKEAILKILPEIYDRLPSFKVANFLRSSKNAFKMIIEAGTSAPGSLAELVDKRYLEQLQTLAPSYGSFVAGTTNLDAKVSEIYMFGNNLFIKVLFTGQNIFANQQNLKEEWTFSKNLLNGGPAWYLNNIDRL